MKRFVGIAGMVFSLIFCVQQIAVAEEWPLSIIWPASNFATQGAYEFAKIVKENSKDKLTITVHPGGALGYKGPEMLRVVKDGMVPVGEMLLGYVASTEPILGLSTLPFLVSNSKEAHDIGVVARPSTEKVFAKWNQKMLYWHFWPGSGLYTKKPIASLADLKGMKIRAFDAISTEWVKNIGAQPVTLPWGDVYMALFTGGVDAVLTSSVSGVDGKFWEVTPYYTNLGFTFGYSAVTVNLRFFNKLPADLQKVLLDAGQEMGPKQEARAMAADETSLATLRKNGITVNEMSSAFRQESMKVSQAMWDTWAKSVGSDAQDLLAEVKKGLGK